MGGCYPNWMTSALTFNTVSETQQVLLTGYLLFHWGTALKLSKTGEFSEAHKASMEETRAEILQPQI